MLTCGVLLVLLIPFVLFQMISEYPWVLLIPIGLFLIVASVKAIKVSLAERKFNQLKAQTEAADAEVRTRAEAGEAKAQCQLGLSYLTGEHNGKDLEAAVKWFRLAAEQGWPAAQCDLGACYEKGNGVPIDYDEAVKWYRLAAQKNEPQAFSNLAWCYRTGNGVFPDAIEAEKLYRRAVEGGLLSASNELEILLASDLYQYYATDPLPQCVRGTRYCNGDG